MPQPLTCPARCTPESPWCQGQVRPLTAIAPASRSEGCLRVLGPEGAKWPGRGSDSPGETHSPQAGVTAALPLLRPQRAQDCLLPWGSRGLSGPISFLQDQEATGAHGLFAPPSKGVAVPDSDIVPVPPGASPESSVPFPPAPEPVQGRRVVLLFLLGFFLVTALAVAATQGRPGDILSWSAPGLSQRVHLIREASSSPCRGPWLRSAGCLWEATRGVRKAMAGPNKQVTVPPSLGSCSK